MKTLYITDLDGTLLRSDQRTSDFTNDVINSLVREGLIFSYATARSSHTAAKVMRGLACRLPVILYNGAFIMDSETGELLYEALLGADFELLLSDIIDAGVCPIVYSLTGGAEKFSFVSDKCSAAQLDFISTRASDPRFNPVSRVDELKGGEPFYVTCIDSVTKLLPLYEKYKNILHCVYSRDIYSGEQWLEFMPREATKANALLKLKELLGCESCVAFGDGVNDLEMFAAADECYAVSNAALELKSVATGVIGSNDEDAVAKWLLKNARLCR